MLETDEKGRVKLSMKALLERPAGMECSERPPREDRGDRAATRGDRGDRAATAHRAATAASAAASRPRRSSRTSGRKSRRRRPPGLRGDGGDAVAACTVRQPATAGAAAEKRMKAIEITSLRRARGAAPGRAARRRSPAPGEVLIRVAASGVNRPDVLQRKGHYPVPPGASDLPGLEVAGDDRRRRRRRRWRAAGFKVGDRVCALVAGGGYAELCVAPVGQCLPVPAGLSDIEAASLPETFFTVWSQRVRPRPPAAGRDAAGAGRLAAASASRRSSWPRRSARR